jgi:anaphase-promoting complex subunit 8
VAYYSQRLYDQAESCFEVVRNKDPFRLQHVDTYSNILYVKEKAAELSYLAHSIVEVRHLACLSPQISESICPYIPDRKVCTRSVLRGRKLLFS